MEDTRSICFEPVTKDDVEAMTMVMKRAFDEDSRRHLGTIGGPPGYDDGEFIRKWYLGSNADAYKIVKDGVIIGGVNVFHRPNHSYMLGISSWIRKRRIRGLVPKCGSLLRRNTQMQRNGKQKHLDFRSVTIISM